MTTKWNKFVYWAKLKCLFSCKPLFTEWWSLLTLLQTDLRWLEPFKPEYRETCEDKDSTRCLSLMKCKGNGCSALTWTSLGSAGTGLQPILDHRCRIRWYIFQRDNSCHTVSPERRESTAQSKTKHRPPSICWCPADRCGWLVQKERVWSDISPQDPFFSPSRSTKPSRRPGPLGLLWEKASATQDVSIITKKSCIFVECYAYLKLRLLTKLWTKPLGRSNAS